MLRAATAMVLACGILTASAVDSDQSAADVAQSDGTVTQPVAESSEDEIAAEVPFTEESGKPASAATRLPSMEEICAVLAASARAHELPLAFFVRLIWQESRFRADAVSPAGARGIAQFMPETAVWRGLDDPYDPIQSLQKSAGYLRDLRAQFGNLGLAAAAYNGGSGRVQAWLQGRGGLPMETRQYVHIVTGLSIDEWRQRQDAIETSRIPTRVPCPVLVALAPESKPLSVARAAPETTAVMQRMRRLPVPGWSVVLAGNFSETRAQAQWARLQRKLSSVLDGRQPTIVSRRVAGRGKARMSEVRIPENDRSSAERLCAKLRTGGASCVVTRAS